MKRWATFLLLISGACCTKMDCSCDQVVIDFTLDPASNFTYQEAEGFLLVTTTKEFKPIDSMKLFFPNNISPVDITHNFLLKNSVTGRIDTIQDITYTPVDSTFECNECIVKKDIQHCTRLNNKQLTFNGDKIKGYTVMIGR